MKEDSSSHRLWLMRAHREWMSSQLAMKEGRMVDLPKKKVGIVACSGEELAEGTVTRLAALKVLEQLRPEETVTICLPLFLAGGEGVRALARFYPTISIPAGDRPCAGWAWE